MNHDGWDLDGLVVALRQQREQALQRTRGWHQPLQLPSRQVLGPLMESLAAALYPHRLGQQGPGQATQEGLGATTDYYVGHTLDACLRALREQVQIELAARIEPGPLGPSAALISAESTSATPPADGLTFVQQANRITSAFAAQL